MRHAPKLGILFGFLLSAPSVASADVMAATKRAKSGAFDAMGEIACAQEVGQDLGPCTAEVARDADAAAVVVTFPNEFSRILTFEDGAFLRGNTTMSGVGTDTEWVLEDGLYRIRVDDQRFDIPETLITGE